MTEPRLPVEEMESFLKKVWKSFPSPEVVTLLEDIEIDGVCVKAGTYRNEVKQ